MRKLSDVIERNSTIIIIGSTEGRTSIRKLLPSVLGKYRVIDTRKYAKHGFYPDAPVLSAEDHVSDIDKVIEKLGNTRLPIVVDNYSDLQVMYLFPMDKEPDMVKYNKRNINIHNQLKKYGKKLILFADIAYTDTDSTHPFVHQVYFEDDYRIIDADNGWS